jgi:tRNA(Ile)-lysidine synthase
MLKLVSTLRLPDTFKFNLALSGGVDSMVALHFLMRGFRIPNRLIFVDHGTETSLKAKTFINSSPLVQEARNRGASLAISSPCPSPPKGVSKESFWRDYRYKFFAYTSTHVPIITCHHLDDCLEQYIITTIVCPREGYKVIPYNGPSKSIRPFRLWKKKDIYNYALTNSIEYQEDISNWDTKFLRNDIRLNLIPRILRMNQGLYKHVAKYILKENVS